MVSSWPTWQAYSKSRWERARSMMLPSASSRADEPVMRLARSWASTSVASTGGRRADVSGRRAREHRHRDGRPACAMSTTHFPRPLCSCWNAVPPQRGQCLPTPVGQRPRTSLGGASTLCHGDLSLARGILTRGGEESPIISRLAPRRNGEKMSHDETNGMQNG